MAGRLGGCGTRARSWAALGRLGKCTPRRLAGDQTSPPHASCAVSSFESSYSVTWQAGLHPPLRLLRRVSTNQAPTPHSSLLAAGCAQLPANRRPHVLGRGRAARELADPLPQVVVLQQAVRGAGDAHSTAAGRHAHGLGKHLQPAGTAARVAAPRQQAAAPRAGPRQQPATRRGTGMRQPQPSPPRRLASWAWQACGVASCWLAVVPRPSCHLASLT